MKNFVLKFTLLVLISFFFTSQSYSTNLVVEKILAKSTSLLNEPVTFGVTVKNDSNFAADTYQANFTVKDSSGNVVYQSSTTGEDLQPYTKATLYASEGWTPLLTGNYNVGVQVDFAYEVAPDDNSDSTETTIIYGWATMSEYCKNSMLNSKLDLTNAMTFVTKEPLAPGDTLASHDESEMSAIVTEYSYLCWTDLDIYARYGHYSKAVVINATDTTQTQSYDLQYWPTINGKNYHAGFQEKIESDDWVLGTPKEPEPVESGNTVTEETTTPVKGDSICAILVSGEGSDADEQKAFDFDVDLFGKNISLESMGPRLPASSVLKMNNPTSQELIDQLRSMKNKYKCIYFFYSGHGSRYSIDTKNSGDDKWLLYFDLAKELYNTNADEIKVVMDNCHSGAVIDNFNMNLFKDKRDRTDLTVIAACDADTVSYTRHLITTANGENVRVGAYTWAFMRCWGEPNADTDNDGKVSLKETFDWVKVQNPSFGNNKQICENLDPQIFVHRKVETAEPVVQPPDTDVTIRYTKEDSSRIAWNVQMHSGVFDTTSFDTTVTGFEGYREWTLKTDMNGYSLNMDFKYHPEFEYLTIEDAKPGILHRDSTGSEWTAVPEVEWIPEDKVIKGYNITELGDFTLGTVIELNTIVESNGSYPVEYRLDQNYPNPFNPLTTIRFVLPNSQKVTLKVYDVLGREVAALVDSNLPAGNHKAEFNAASFPSGLYMVKLETADFVATKKMMLVK